MEAGPRADGLGTRTGQVIPGQNQLMGNPIQLETGVLVKMRRAIAITVVTSFQTGGCK